MLHSSMQMVDRSNESFDALAVVLVPCLTTNPTCSDFRRCVSNASWTLAVFEKEDVCQLIPANGRIEFANDKSTNCCGSHCGGLTALAVRRGGTSHQFEQSVCSVSCFFVKCWVAAAEDHVIHKFFIEEFACLFYGFLGINWYAVWFGALQPVRNFLKPSPVLLDVCIPHEDRKFTSRVFQEFRPKLWVSQIDRWVCCHEYTVARQRYGS